METADLLRTVSARVALLCAALLAGPARPLVASTAPGTRNRTEPAQDKAFQADQISIQGKLGGAPELLYGLVTADQQGQVVVQLAGKETRLDSELVMRISWGEAPPSYTDGRSAFRRGQFANAAAQFRMAAADADARDVVRAAARLWAARALLSSAASDPAHFAAAGEEAERFLASYPTHREVALARMLQARACLMAGQTAEAARLYRSIYAEWKPADPKPGYRSLVCFEAGLNAARVLCQLKPPDALDAREIYTSLESAVGAELARLEPSSPARALLTRLRGEASLGEGFVELAAGNSAQAHTFFESKLAALDGSDSLRFAAGLGLAQAQQASGMFRAAQLEFARVSALEHSDRDRAAAAQIGLAETTLALKDQGAVVQARGWLEAVVKTCGDTPACKRARELLGKL